MAKTKQACKNADKIYHTFYIVNQGTAVCYNATGELVIPDGLQLNYRSSMTSEGDVTPGVSTGVFNPVTSVWMVGNLAAGQKEQITIELEVIDDTLFGADDFIVEFQIKSSCVEDDSDNVDWLCIEKYCPTGTTESCDNLNITLK